MQEKLPEAFNGTNPYAETATLLRYQPDYKAVKLPSGETKEVPINLAGRLAKFQDRWERLDPSIGRALAQPIAPNWIFGKPAPPTWRQPAKEPQSQVEKTALQNELLKYEIMGCFEDDPTLTPDHMIDIFVVPKKDTDEWRLTLNAKPQNPYIFHKHFKQEGLLDVQQTCRVGDYLVNSDLRCAYLHVAGQEEWRRSFKCWVNGKLKRWTCLFFGAKDAPRRFTKLVQLPVTWLRRMGVRVNFKLDDFLTMADSYWKAKAHGNATVILLDFLGFTLHAKKSVWSPTQKIIWLGTEIDTKEFVFKLTDTKAKKYAKHAKKILKKARARTPVHLHDLRVMAGQIASTTMCVDLARLKSNWIRWGLRQATKNSDSKTVMPPEAEEELEWWYSLPQHPEEAQKTMETMALDEALRVETDWSGLGIGAVWVDESRQVLDEYHQYVQITNSEEHNNVGETRGIVQGLIALARAHNWKDTSVLVFNDNVTACSYVNKQGGRFPWIFQELHPLFSMLRARNIKICACWIAGEENFWADRVSRRENSPEEQTLRQWAFDRINARWGPMTIDCFATQTNTRLERFISGGPEVNSEGRDFFKQKLDPNRELLYAHTPAHLVQRTISKIVRERLSIILIVPLWTSRPWWPIILERLADFPLILGKQTSLWQEGRGEELHSPKPHFSIAVNLSARYSGAKDFRRYISTLSSEDIKQIVRESSQPWLSTPRGGVDLFNDPSLREFLSSLRSIVAA